MILDLDLGVISFEGTSTRVNMGSRQGQEVGGDFFGSKGNPGFEGGLRGDQFIRN